MERKNSTYRYNFACNNFENDISTRFDKCWIDRFSRINIVDHYQNPQLYGCRG